MSRKHKKSKLEITQVKAWKYYQTWRKTGSICPAFNGERVYVTRLGWNHLVSPRKKRTSKEKVRRFQALPLANWALSAHMDGQKIKVILSSKNKKKYFLSVIVLK